MLQNVFHKRHGQLHFHFVILSLKYAKELDSFIFCGTKVQIVRDKKYIVSVPYLSVFEFLAYNSLHIRKLYGIALMTFQTLPNFVGDIYVAAVKVFKNCNG